MLYETPEQQLSQQLQNMTNSVENVQVLKSEDYIVGLQNDVFTGTQHEYLNPQPTLNPQANFEQVYSSNLTDPLPMINSTTQFNEQIPETTDYPGVYGFELSIGNQVESKSKNKDHIYVKDKKKLFIKKQVECPIFFRTRDNNIPPNSHIRILPVYKTSHVLTEPVQRCLNHADDKEEENKRFQFIRARNPHVLYVPDTRSYLIIPFNGPQPGSDEQMELLSFMCFNSCANSKNPSQRKIHVIFTLENDQFEILGRQVIEVRVCACPGRDCEKEEGKTWGPKRIENRGRKRKYSVDDDEYIHIKRKTMDEIIDRFTEIQDFFSSIILQKNSTHSLQGTKL